MACQKTLVLDLQKGFEEERITAYVWEFIGFSTT